MPTRSPESAKGGGGARGREILARCKSDKLQLVRFLYCGNDSVIRGKACHTRFLNSYLRSGIGLTVAMQSFNMLDQLVPEGSFGPVGEIRLVPDPESFAVLPYTPKSARLLCDMLTLEGEPWGACPRSFLKRMIERGRQAGVALKAAFENEFTLARHEGGQYVPLDRSPCFSTIGMDSAAPVMIEIIEALMSQGVYPEQYYAELGPGQQELPVRFADALRAADNQITVRETARGVALRHGLLASFAPKPFPDQAGNGSHVHRRLQPRFWSSAYTAWGPDNREAAVRVPSKRRGLEMESTNLELKPCDPSSNPYLALGGLLAAGLDGMERKLDPGEPALVDPDTLSQPERTRRGIRRLPTSLAEALDALERDEVLRAALGDTLAREYLVVKRSEVRGFEGKDVTFEIEQHFYKY